jgi:gluconolactonase
VGAGWPGGSQRDNKGGGFLLVAGVLDRIDAGNAVSVFMEKAGYTGDDVNNVGTQTRSGRSHVLLIGPSCSGVEPQGRIVWCADNDRKLMRLEKDGTRTVLSEGADGKRFSGPNDISIRCFRTRSLAASRMGSPSRLTRDASI